MTIFHRWASLAFLVAALSASTAAIAQPRMIQSGETVEGTLASGDAFLIHDGSFYDMYLYSGRSGEEIVITLRSTDFDAFLIGGPTEEAVFDMVQSDDDGAGGTDAQLTVSASGSGQYYFMVNTFEIGETGAYRVGVASVGVGASIPPTSPPVTSSAQPRMIRSGDTVSGTLTSNDAVLTQDGSFYDLYLYSGRPGEEIVVTLRSSDFDAFLIGGPTQFDAFNRFEDNDDGADGTNSELTASTNAAGQYYFLVNTFAAGESGAYQVGVSSAGGVASAPSTPPTLPPEPSTAIAATGGTHAMAYRGRNGERLTFQCSAGTPSTAVWGTGLYTDDSRICAAGVHAGVITPASGGLVTIEIRPGASSYTGSTQHGVRSANYGSWAGSYAVVRGGSPAPSPGASSGQPRLISVEIDCYHSSLSSTSTGHPVWIEFWSGDRRVGRENGIGIRCTASGGDPTFSLSTSEDITEVRVVIEGEDAFFIDELKIYRSNGSGGLGSLVRHHGQEDGDGWCLSTDPGDARGDWGSRVSSCVSTQAFGL